MKRESKGEPHTERKGAEREGEATEREKAVQETTS
jgi:hypothetical protein